jgi:hypothetical protein
MKQQSIFDALVKLSKKNAPEEAAEELPSPLHPRDRRSARARAAHARQRRATARWEAKKPPSRFAPKRTWPSIGRRCGSQPPPGVSVLDRIVRSMQPGYWYARSDLGNLADLTESERIGVRLFSHGYLIRRRNPEFRQRVDPEYLYTLTQAGEQRRDFLLALAENDASHVAPRTEGAHS